jgi:hypothetical protein
VTYDFYMPESTEPDIPDPTNAAEPVSDLVKRTLLELADWQAVAERMKERNSSRKSKALEPPAEDAPGAAPP